MVAIACYGERNLPCLKRVIQNYRSMSLKVDVVVLSEAPKDLGPDVRVVVGLPSENPWSLPFAHKKLFAENADRYDLFIYSEDDNEVGEKHIRAFLDATPHLAEDEIAGFLRYEISPSGVWFLDEALWHFHWRPTSARRRGPYTVAEFTNDHAGFYLLTRAQLKRAIASGGFLREPYEGRYDLLCTAATDPYTSCGFRKVICVSALEEFLIHHMSNRYADRLDVSLESFKKQIETLIAIQEGRHPSATLFIDGVKFWHSWWQKSYYEKPAPELLAIVPREAKTILSLGCGWGATEAKLQERGAQITAVPLDSVIGAAAVRPGIEMIYGTWEQCLKVLAGRRFDCVLMTNLLHLQDQPGQCLKQCSQFVEEGGSLVLGGPNFDRVPWLLKRLLGIGEFGKLRNYEQSGMSVCGPKTLSKPIAKAGLEIASVQWLNHAFNKGRLRGKQFVLGSLTARDWILHARRREQFPGSGK